MAILATVLTVGWFTQPDRFTRGYAPTQPLPFSHRLHAGTMRIPCAFCHSGATRSRAAGVPSVETCMGCHKNTRTDSPAIRELTRIYERGEALPWIRVHTLPDHVFFDHRPHVNAGIACQSCHGEVQTMERVSRRMAMRMANCLACHRDPHGVLPPGSTVARGAEHCSACHR
jgi:hypothetical protein